MKDFFINLCLLLIVFFPLTTQAEVTGEVVFVHPDYRNELWFVDFRDINNPRLLFEMKQAIYELSVQKNGANIATVAAREDKPWLAELYLFNTNSNVVEEHNLTQLRFTDISNVSISQRGDIVFTGTELDGRSRGIYLISRSEALQPIPQIKQLKKIKASNLVWAPNGNHISYDTAEGVFLLNIKTGEDFRVSKGASMPAFSPGGKKIAFIHRFLGITHELEIISIDTLRSLKVIKDFVPHAAFLGLKWSPDGRHIVYTTYGKKLFNKGTTYHNIAIPIDGGSYESILDMFEHGVPMFDYWRTNTYAIEPTNRLTTLWGKLKK